MLHILFLLSCIRQNTKTSYTISAPYLQPVYKGFFSNTLGVPIMLHFPRTFCSTQGKLSAFCSRVSPYTFCSLFSIQFTKGRYFIIRKFSLSYYILQNLWIYMSIHFIFADNQIIITSFQLSLAFCSTVE